MKKLFKDNRFRILILIVGDFSLIFGFFTYVLRKLTSPISITLTALIFLVMLFIFTHTMICDLFFDEASKFSTAELNIDKANANIERMKKCDIVHTYHLQYVVFKSIYYRDKLEFNKLETLMKDPILQKNPSSLLVYTYNMMLIAIHNKKHKDVETYFTSITEIYQKAKAKTTLKKDKAALIYALGMIKAEYYLFTQELPKVHSSLNEVTTSRLNHRELAYFYSLNAKYFKRIKNTSQYESNLVRAKDEYPDAEFLKNL
jgi:hypothetical protein